MRLDPTLVPYVAPILGLWALFGLFLGMQAGYYGFVPWVVSSCLMLAALTVSVSATRLDIMQSDEEDIRSSAMWSSAAILAAFITALCFNATPTSWWLGLVCAVITVFLWGMTAWCASRKPTGFVWNLIALMPLLPVLDMYLVRSGTADPTTVHFLTCFGLVLQSFFALVAWLLEPRPKRQPEPLAEPDYRRDDPWPPKDKTLAGPGGESY